MKAKKATAPAPRPIRVSDIAYRQAKQLVEVASLKGWSALGIERTDPPSMMAILEESLALLARQSRKS
jgi:hypothetical protein